MSHPSAAMSGLPHPSVSSQAPDTQSRFPNAAAHHGNRSEPPAQATTAAPAQPLNSKPAADQHDAGAPPAPPGLSAAARHSLTNSLYQCADCKKRYSRPEHLARHIQTHTLGKRFICQICGKAFARADLLKRHTANHSNDNDTTKKRRRIDASPGAGRVSHACRACAAARVKCEEVKPCTRCRNRNIQCESVSGEPVASDAHYLHFNPGSNGFVDSGEHRASHPDQAQFPFQPSGSAPALGIDGSPDIKPSPSQSEMDVLPTGDAMDQSSIDMHDYSNVGTDPGRLPFSDFLRDVLFEHEARQNVNKPAENLGQGLSILNFGDDINYDLSNMDFSTLDHWNLDEVAGPESTTPQTDNSEIDMNSMRRNLVKIWTESPWRWVPKDREGGYVEHGNLPLPIRDTASQRFQESQKRADRVVNDKLDQSSRDKVMSVILASCRDNGSKSRVASSFPSTETLDTLVHVFLAAHSCTVSSYTHFSTFKMNAQWPEWLAVAAAGGAVATSITALRKFGFAVQEAVRVMIPEKFEENNPAISNLGLVQTLVLMQDIGLWSGNRRKMEIAECHLLIPITMMRYRQRFKVTSYPPVVVDAADEGEVLDAKWKCWHENEAWKRLIFHCFLRDAQTSMATLSSPLMSYAELTLPLPECKDLWFAKNATEWKKKYLRGQGEQTKRLPCLGDLMRDSSLLPGYSRRLDAQFAISIYLHGFWSLIYEWRQLSAVFRNGAWATNQQGESNAILDARHRDLCKTLEGFQMVVGGWHATLSAQEALMLNLDFMNLHVCLDDLQLFAGKEGEEQARKVYPMLQRWAESAGGRQGVWHAGQVLRQAKMFPRLHLKDFYAVGVHHATLAIWTYGVVSKASSNQGPVNDSATPTYIDGVESREVQQFIEYGQGRPYIRSPRSKDKQMQEVESSIEDPRSCMEIAQDVLRANFHAEQEFAPPIVENLCSLIQRLGDAAWAVGLA